MNSSTHSSAEVSRRDALKLMGLGLAVAGLGFNRAGAAEVSAAGVDGWVLPKLPYAYDALEPHIDARTMEIHHSKHHQAYITAGKAALEKYPDLLKLTPEQLVASLGSISVPEAVRTTLRNQAGGHVNHTFFWKIIAPGGGGVLPEPLGEDINKTFGSLDELKKQFNDAAAKRFGSGWAWLSLKDGKLMVHSTANQDSPLTEGATPIIGLDVWEHAYYLKYQNVRADYTKAFWNVVNWTQAGANYAAAKKSLIEHDARAMGSKSIEEVGIPEARHHVFLCVGPKCCSEREGEETWKHIKSEVKDRDLPMLRTKADCFRMCSEGPWMVVYPDGVWYAEVTPKRFDRIRREHIEGGVPVAEWVRAVNPLSPAKS